MRASSIFLISLYILLFPIYVYAGSKWYQWRHHAFFRIRYSYPDGFILLLCTITVTHINLIHNLLDDIGIIYWAPRADNAANILLQLAFTLTYTTWSLTFYRANLIFLTWKQHQTRLYQMGIATVLDVDMNTKSKCVPCGRLPRRHCTSYALLALASGGSVLYLCLSLSWLYPLTGVLWFIHYAILIGLFIVVQCKKVKELLGCLYETYFIFVVIAIWWIFELVFGANEGDPMRIAYGICDHIFSLSILYFTLYFVYKSEGTLNRNVNVEDMIVSEQSDPEEMPTTPDIEMDERTIANSQRKPVIVMCLSNKAQYEQLSQYLAACFSLENLMFIERICVLRWCIMARRDSKKVEEVNDPQEYAHYALRFLFLEAMYKEYNDVLVDGDFIANRSVLWSICHGIYEEFICSDAPNQINIPFEVWRDLEKKLETKNEIETHFQSYDDFLTLFTVAMENAWFLLQTIYDFKFVSYLNQTR
eukprot:230085_1